jgi:hypothetical protein
MLASIIICAVPVSAVTLKETPLQTQFSHDIANSFEMVSFALVDFSGDELSTPSTQSDRKNYSMVRAGLYSALLPGLGEYYVGHRSKARVFFTVEAATWITFFTFHIYGNWKENDFVDYAAVHANASLNGKSDEFEDWVGFYEDIDQFNSLGRVQDPERPYLVDNAENHWRWQSANEQSTFRHLKNRSREAFRRRDFMVGLAIVSRVVSIVDAVRDARRANRKIDDGGFSIADKINYRLEINPFDDERPISMALYTRF